MYEMIGTNKNGFFIEKAIRGHGRGHYSCQVRTIGHYCQNEPNINLVMGIKPDNPYLPPEVDGSIQCPRRWIHIPQTNCDQFVFANFFNSMFVDTEENIFAGGSDDTRTLLRDNLRSHKTAYVVNILQDRVFHYNFRSANRPPYCPKNAPIKYCFFVIASELSLHCCIYCKIDTICRKLVDICSIVRRDVHFYATFIHSG